MNEEVVNIGVTDEKSIENEKLEVKEEESVNEIENIIESYKNEKLFQSYELLQNFKKENDVENNNNIDNITLQMFVKIEREYQESRLVLTELYETSGWKLSSTTNDGIRTYFKLSKEETLNLRKKKENRNEENDEKYWISSFRIEGDVESPIFNILSLFYEIDLYPHWVMAMKDARLLERYSKFRFCCYYGYKVPFPFYDRDIASYGYGVDNLEDEGILVIVRSLDKEEYEEFSNKIPPLEEKKCVRIDCNYTAFLVKPISENKTHVRIMCSLNPYLNYIPNWIVNLLVKIAAPYVIRKIREHSKNIDENKDSLHAKRIKENPEIYNDIKERCERIFNKEEKLK